MGTGRHDYNEDDEAMHVSFAPIEDPRILAKAREAEKLRRAGTHVYHPDFGVIALEEAAQRIEDGDARRKDFRGHPETGAVDWKGAVPKQRPARLD